MAPPAAAPSRENNKPPSVSAAAADGAMNNSTLPGRNDILGGRGRGFSKHLGNARFQALVHENIERYNKVCSHPHKHKADVIKELLSSLEEAGQRFLEYDANNTRWIQVSKEVAKEKIAMAFRNHKRIKIKQQLRKQQKQRPTAREEEPALASSPSSPREAEGTTAKAGENRAAAAAKRNSKPSLQEQRFRQSSGSSAESATAANAALENERIRAAVLQNRHMRQQELLLQQGRGLIGAESKNSVLSCAPAQHLPPWRHFDFPVGTIAGWQQQQQQELIMASLLHQRNIQDVVADRQGTTTTDSLSLLGSAGHEQPTVRRQDAPAVPPRRPGKITPDNQVTTAVHQLTTVFPGKRRGQEQEGKQELDPQRLKWTRNVPGRRGNIESNTTTTEEVENETDRMELDPIPSVAHNDDLAENEQRRKMEKRSQGNASTPADKEASQHDKTDRAVRPVLDGPTEVPGPDHRAANPARARRSTGHMMTLDGSHLADEQHVSSILAAQLLVQQLLPVGKVVGKHTHPRVHVEPTRLRQRLCGYLALSDEDLLAAFSKSVEAGTKAQGLLTSLGTRAMPPGLVTPDIVARGSCAPAELPPRLRPAPFVVPAQQEQRHPARHWLAAAAAAEQLRSPPVLASAMPNPSLAALAARMYC